MSSIILNPPFTLESFLSSLEESDYRIKITYNDDSCIEGFITQEYQDGKMKYIIFEPPYNPRSKTPYHFIDIDNITHLEILTR